MPVQRTQSSLLGKLGDKLKKAAAAHKEDPVEYGNIELQAGINNGIAQLVDCKFMPIAAGKQNAGEYMLYMAGIVKVPTEHSGIPVQGLRTSVTEIICDTPGRSRKTIDEHVAFVQNELKKLVGKDEAAANPDLFSGENLESTAEMLKEAQPHFRFRTWKGSKQVVAKSPDGKWRVFDEDDKGNRSPNKRMTGAWTTEEAAKKANPYADGREPRVNHDWQGRCEYTSDGSEGAVVDNTAPSANGTPAATEESEGVDIAALVTAAAEGNEKAMAKLNELAQKAGVDSKDVEGAGNWGEVASLIEVHQGGGAQGEEGEVPAEEPAEPKPPEKGDLYSYKPFDPKTKKKGKAIEIEVVSVDKAKSTVTAKSNDTKKLLMDLKTKKALVIPFDELEEA